ncbi:hypothetical protein LCGC14_0370150 [marine sediment metagenome]|uniref:Uncharacterized protein n=1 Tax=marine sediment metagenome TaxID=412755 RepID=A0A0F9VSR3_9ZZZZ
MTTENKLVITKAPAKRIGRPKIVIDYEQVYAFAKIWCTQEEIASMLNVSSRSLLRDDTFCQVYKKGLDEGKSSLRRIQYQKAMGRETVYLTDDAGNLILDGKGRGCIQIPGYAPDTTMQIWLGKQNLGQKDIVEHEVGEGVKDFFKRLIENRDR